CRGAGLPLPRARALTRAAREGGRRGDGRRVRALGMRILCEGRLHERAETESDSADQRRHRLLVQYPGLRLACATAATCTSVVVTRKNNTYGKRSTTKRRNRV